MSNQTTVVIVNWNGAKFISPLLESLKEGNPAKIIVIDNASSDSSHDYLKTDEGIHLIWNKENVGFGRAANQGIQASTTPYVLLLNVDTRALPGAIMAMEKFLDKNSSAAIVAPQLLFPDGTLQASCRHFPTILNYSLFLSYLDYIIPAGYRIRKSKHKKLRVVDQPMGAALMMRRSALDQIGLFDPQFSLFMEEIDLCKRIKEHGWEIVYLSEAKFIHHAGGSTSQDWERSQMAYFQNVIRVFSKALSRKTAPTRSGLLIRSFDTAFVRECASWKDKARQVLLSNVRPDFQHTQMNVYNASEHV